VTIKQEKRSYHEVAATFHAEALASAFLFELDA
jgi:hypothetical protein